MNNPNKIDVLLSNDDGEDTDKEDQSRGTPMKIQRDKLLDIVLYK